MGSIILAVVVASLLGSLHCVGMCGPFAIWATETKSRWTAMGAYHLGRLATFLSAGLIAGLVGTALTVGGDFAGLQLVAAKLAGIALIAVGILRVMSCFAWFRKPPKPSVAETAKPSLVVTMLQHAKPALASRGAIGRGFLTGLMTTWLPCGWLYLFVLAAAGTGDVASSLAVMTSFWVGTLPALTSVALGAGVLWRRFPTTVPAIAGLILIVAGMYTATGRASADLASVTPPSLSTLSADVQQPMPCCEAAP